MTFFRNRRYISGTNGGYAFPSGPAPDPSPNETPGRNTCASRIPAGIPAGVQKNNTSSDFLLQMCLIPCWMSPIRRKPNEWTATCTFACVMASQIGTLPKRRWGLSLIAVWTVRCPSRSGSPTDWARVWVAAHAGNLRSDSWRRRSRAGPQPRPPIDAPSPPHKRKLVVHSIVSHR